MMRFAAALIAAIPALWLAACDRVEPPAPAAGPPSATATAAPQAVLPHIDLAGLRRLAADAGAQERILVVDFWATWCAPCMEMFPELHEGLAELGPRVELASVTLDDPEREAMAVEFLRGHDALEHAYMLAPDEEERLRVVDQLSPQWQHLVVPAVFVYGPDGELAGEFVSVETAEPILARVRELLQAQSWVPHENAGSQHQQGL